MQHFSPEFAAVCDIFAKFSTLHALGILTVMCDYNEIYLSIFSAFHEIMLCAKWTSQNDDGFLRLGGPFKAGRTVDGVSQGMHS